MGDSRWRHNKDHGKKKCAYGGSESGPSQKKRKAHVTGKQGNLRRCNAGGTD